MLCGFHFLLLSIAKFLALLAVVFCFFLNRPEPDILPSFSIHNVTVSMYVHMLYGAPL